MFDFLRQEYAAARLRAMKGRLIDRAKFSKLAKAKSVSEIANILEGTDYESAFYHGLEKDLMEMENDLDKIFVNLLEKVKGFYYGKDRGILDLFLKEWEVKNLKLLMKSILTGEDLRSFLIPLKEGFDLEGLTRSKDMEDFLNRLKDTDYYEPIYSGYRKIEQFGLPIIDFYLEETYAKIFLNVAKGVEEREMVVSYLKTRNDLINLRNISRSIIFKKDLSEFFIHPSNVRREWFKLGSMEALSEKLRSKKFGVDLANLEDDMLLEIALGQNLEETVSRFLLASPFDTGLLLYFLIMRRNETNRIKVITKFVKEDLDRKDLKMFLGLEE